MGVKKGKRSSYPDFITWLPLGKPSRETAFEPTKKKAQVFLSGVRRKAVGTRSNPVSMNQQRAVPCLVLVTILGTPALPCAPQDAGARPPRQVVEDVEDEDDAPQQGREGKRRSLPTMAGGGGAVVSGRGPGGRGSESGEEATSSSTGGWVGLGWKRTVRSVESSGT